MKSVHESITFAEGYKDSFANFKKAFSHVECFKKIPHEQRDEEMKKVHKRVLKETEQFEKKQKSEKSKVSKSKNELSNSDNISKETDSDKS